VDLEKRLDELEGKVRSLEGLNQKMQRLSGEGQDWFERIDQQVKIIDRKLEVDQEAAREKAKTTPVIDASSKGFFIRTPDGNFKMRIGGWIQTDGRYFTGDTRNTGSTFVMRRVRPLIEGTVFKYFDYRVMMDFGRGASVLQDAFIDANYMPQLRVRAGKFKAPVGLERLQDDRYLMFAERAFPTQLVPDRDIGVMVHGSLLEDTLIYQLAALNGETDNVATVDADNNNAKDFAGRVFVHPFGRTKWDFARGFGMGFAGTIGNERGATLDTFRSVGQTTIFTFNSGAVAAGQRFRYSPQANYLWGPLSAQAEYVQNTQQVGRGTPTKPISNQAWQLAAAYVLTGEDATFGSSVKPRHKFDPFKQEWGAFEIAARTSGLSLDRDAFNNGFASYSTSVRDAFGWGFGLNWYLNDNVKLQTDFFRTKFTNGAPGDRNKPDESVVINELQLTF
jgi:phosphate-selective porin OprO/OprP